MSEPQTAGTTLVPGLLIGAGASLGMSGLSLLWLALDPSRPDDPVGILDRGMWIGPIVMVVGLALLAMGWLWLRKRATTRGAGWQAATEALLGVIVLYSAVLYGTGRWRDAVCLAMSVVIVIVAIVLGVGRRGRDKA